MNPAEENEPRPLRIIGIPKRKNGKYVLEEFAILNRECGWICPRCNNEVAICPTQAGEQTFTCKACNASFVVRVDAEANTFMMAKKQKPATPAVTPAAAAGTAGIAVAGAAAQQQAQRPARGMLLIPEDPVPEKRNAIAKPANQPVKDLAQPDDKPKPATPVATGNNDDNETMMVAQPKKSNVSSQQDTNGQLQWGGFFSRKHYALHQGANIIGRKDGRQPSDLEFDDPEMSRRSVKIDAIPDGKGQFTFTLTVLKSLNPVTLNGSTLAVGASVRLNPNDSIVMGKTTFTFKCSK